MRTLLIITCCLFLYSMEVNAQSANSGDCRTAIPVCADAPISITVDGRGAIDDFDPEVITATGCLEKGSLNSANIENNTSWLVFRAGTGGRCDLLRWGSCISTWESKATSRFGSFRLHPGHVRDPSERSRPSGPLHSTCMALTGSTRLARLAGTKAARIPTRRKPPATAPKVRGSMAPTW